MVDLCPICTRTAVEGSRVPKGRKREPDPTLFSSEWHLRTSVVELPIKQALFRGF